MSALQSPDPAPPAADPSSWLESVTTWLGDQAPVLSALAALVVLATAAVGGWRYLRRAIVRRTPPRAVRTWQRFASHIESQLRRLDEREEWRDYRFARLEAEVEAEGRQRNRLFRWRGRRQDGLRRERSLLDALKHSSERLITLQGDPGSGKSISLRKVAIELAREAMRSTRKNQKIPLYINLKELRPGHRPVDAAAIREFVLSSLNQANSRDVDRFLEAEFDRGMAEGRWLFLFDSFDEIPDVLSADRVDETVTEYADALYDLLHGMNTSRGVIASREFRGPYGYGWPRFTIQRLTAAQRRELIKRAELPPAAEQAVTGGLSAAEPPVARLAENPMLLGLLCEHVREAGEFPRSSHIVFETFVESRLRRDADRVERRFGIGPDALRALAEEIAFHLAADESLGLSPSRSQVAVALAAAGRGSGGLHKQLDALEYVKLAHAPEATAPGDDRPFTFAHRRFQEYFATCAVIRQPTRVPLEVLLLDGRWRETAVTMLQTQPADAVSGLVAEAERRLLAGIAQLPPERPAGFFPWPPESRHLLSLLDAGTANRPDLVPERLGGAVGGLLRRVWDEGRRLDRKWAIESSAMADPQTSTDLIEGVFATDSALLQQAAYRRAGRLSELPASLADHIRQRLVGQSYQGRMLRDWPAITAQIRRLAQPTPWLDFARLLRWAPIIDVLVIMPLFLATLAVLAMTAGTRLPPLMAVTTLPLVAWSYVYVSWVVASRYSARSGRAETPVSPFHLAVALAGLVGLRTTVAFMLVSAVGVDVWRTLQAGDAEYRTWLSVVAVVVACGCALVWPQAVVGAVLDRKAVPPSRWPWLPFTVVPRFWHRLRLGTPWGLFRLLSSFVVDVFTLPILMFWWNVEVWLDGRSVRRLGHDDTLTVVDLQQVLGRLRHPTGVYELVNAVRRQELTCTPEGIELLEGLAARAEASPQVGIRRSILMQLRRPDWFGSPEVLPERALDQIALISEARLRAAGAGGGPRPVAPAGEAIAKA